MDTYINSNDTLSTFNISFVGAITTVRYIEVLDYISF